MYIIADYDERYRPYDKSGGELKRADWVKLPVKPKGEGLQTLLEYPRGLEIFGIWCLLLEKATAEKKPENRGLLLNHRELPASISEIAKAISLPTKTNLVKKAINALLDLGWVISENTSEFAEETSSKSRVIKSNKYIYREFVQLTSEEYKTLENLYGKKTTEDYIKRLNDYIGSKGDKYKSHYHTIRNWLNRNGVQPKAEKQKHETASLEKKRKEMRKEYSQWAKQIKPDNLLDTWKNNVTLRWLIEEMRPEIKEMIPRLKKN